MLRIHHLHPMVFAAGLILLSAPPVDAVDGKAVQLAQSQHGTVSEQEIRTYAAAVTEVRELSAEWQQRIQQDAKSDQDLQQMRRQANQEMVQAIRDEGLSVEDYNRITQISAENPEISKKIVGHLTQ